MTENELRTAAKNNKLPSLICLYGEEAFLLDECLTYLLDTTVDRANRDFNLLVVDAKEVVPADIMDTAKTFPVFAARRMIVVKQANNLNASQLDLLIDYIKHPVAECCLVLVANKIDKRKKFFQQFKKNGEMVEFKPLYANKIPAFVQGRLRNLGKQISEDGMALFCRRVGSNLSEIVTELNKLCSYCGDAQVIDTADVAAVVSDSKINSIFDLTDAIGAKDLARSYILLERLQDEGEAPLKILLMITRHFRQLWKTSSLLEQRVAQQDIARRVRINPYFLPDIMRQAKGLSSASYPKSFELFIELDLALKSSGAQPKALLQKLAQDLVHLA
ncbi:MAG: DNA polymerase III subunit delta [Desulfuromonas sp.]|nr:DNA polymerase III subunit delta [Desulfuromonas sp.]